MTEINTDSPVDSPITDQPTEQPTNNHQNDNNKSNLDDDSKVNQPSKESPKDELEEVELEEELDEKGKEKKVSIKRVKAMAAQAKQYRQEIADLKNEINAKYILKSDSSLYDLPERNTFASDEEYKDSIDSHITALMNNKGSEIAKMQAAQINVLSNLQKYNPELIGRLQELGDLPKDTQYYIAGSPVSHLLTDLVLNGQGVKEYLNQATPEQAKAFLSSKEGEIHERQKAMYRQQQDSVMTFFNNLAENTNTLTGGRIDVESFKKIASYPQIVGGLMMTESAPALMAYLSDNEQIVKQITQLPLDRALFEIGKLEAKANIYTKSAQFLKKYPKTKDYRADENYKGSGTTPQGLHEGLSDAEWNKRYNKQKSRK